jgi:outer membrane protein
LSIISARGAEDRAKANQRWALGSFLPRVSASYNYSKSKTFDITSQLNSAGTTFPKATQEDQDRTSKSLGLSGSMYLFNLGNWFNYFGASVDRTVAHLDVINSEQDLIYSVKTSYYAFLAADENVAVQEQAVRRSEEQLKLIQSRYDLGSAALSDVLKQKVQYGNDRLTLLSAQNGVTDARAVLSYTIGLDPNVEVEYSGDYAKGEYVGTLNDAIEFGRLHQPGLLSAQKALKASDWAVKSTYSSYLPTVSLVGSYGWSDGTSGDTVTYNLSSKSRTFGFSVSWNIFDGFSRERSVSMAKINRNNARAALSDTRNLVSQEIKTAYLQIQKLKEQRKVSQENVGAAEEDLKITQEKYNLGAATILDLLNAQVSLKEAQVALIRADFDLNLAVARLENAMGKM